MSTVTSKKMSIFYMLMHIIGVLTFIASKNGAEHIYARLKRHKHN